MPTYWQGDDHHRLPAHRVEPYRLWFEFLKLALRDPDISVDQSFYADWGDVSGSDFSPWWSAHWRKLFAIDISVWELEPHETASVAGHDGIVVRLPLGQDPSKTLRDVRQLLEQHGAGTQLATIPKGRFALSDGAETRFLKIMPQVRIMLRMYGIWLDHADYGRKKRVELSARAFRDWAQGWNDQIRERGWNRDRTYLPMCFNIYVDFLDEKAADGGRRVAGRSAAVRDAEDPRNQVVRYIRKARRIAENVGRGEFPGKYG
jgi:hypothetical protein